MITLDRMITTDMSANIVADLVKRGWSLRRIAGCIDAPVEFVQRVQAKVHVLTLRDVKILARQAGQTPYLMLLNSMHNIRPELKPLFDSTRRMLETTASVGAPRRDVRANLKKRRLRKRAA